MFWSKISATSKRAWSPISVTSLTTKPMSIFDPQSHVKSKKGGGGRGLREEYLTYLVSTRCIDFGRVCNFIWIYVHSIWLYLMSHLRLIDNSVECVIEYFSFEQSGSLEWNPFDSWCTISNYAVALIPFNTFEGNNKWVVRKTFLYAKSSGTNSF